jgi:hypothetical protein
LTIGVESILFIHDDKLHGHKLHTLLRKKPFFHLNILLKGDLRPNCGKNLIFRTTELLMEQKVDEVIIVILYILNFFLRIPYLEINNPHIA